MSQERLSMKKLKEVLRLHFECNLSNRKIARALKISATTVGSYVKAVHSAEINWSDIVSLDDTSIRQLIDPHCQHIKPKKETAPVDYVYIHQELKRKGVTRELLHEEYLRDISDGQGLSYNAFCKRYRDFKNALQPSMRQTHIAGENK